MRTRKIVLGYYPHSARYPLGLDKVYIHFCVIIMEASLRIQAIAGSSWLAGASFTGAAEMEL